jgi:hypothetical protein
LQFKPTAAGAPPPPTMMARTKPNDDRYEPLMSTVARLEILSLHTVRKLQNLPVEWFGMMTRYIANTNTVFYYDTLLRLLLVPQLLIIIAAITTTTA